MLAIINFITIIFIFWDDDILNLITTYILTPINTLYFDITIFALQICLLNITSKFTIL